MRDLIPFPESRLSLSRSMFDEIDRALNGIFGKDFFPTTLNRSAYPKMNIYDEQDNLCVDVYVPEVPKDKLSVKVKDGILTVEGNTRNDKEIDSNKYYCREVSHRSFSRSVRLPDNISMENITAKHEDGMLKVVIPYNTKEIDSSMDVKIS